MSLCGGGGGTGNYVYQLVNDLADRRFVELFRTITATNPSNEFLSAFMRASSTTRRKRNLPVLLRDLQRYKVVHPLVFALLRKFVEAQGESRQGIARAVHRCLNDLSSFVVRVSFCEAKFEPSRYESAFANCANRINSSSSPTDINIHADLRECDERRIMDDIRFASQLADVELKDVERAKRLLFGVNAFLDREARALDIDGCSVEHILPQSEMYWSGWDGFVDIGIGTDMSGWVHRVGNLTLLGDSGNFSRRQFNVNFDAKREIFGESPFLITRDLALIKEWTPDQIVSRSANLAKTAARVWSFSRSRSS